MGINKERAKKGREKLDGKRSEEDLEAQKLKDARHDAEQRFRKLLDRRNALNDEARQAREARDAINMERRRIYDEVAATIAARDALTAQIKGHKSTRNEAQARGRQLIALKQEKRKGAVGGAGQKLRELEAAVKALEFKQQTVPMTGPKEQELIKELQGKMKEMEEVKKLKAAQDAVFGEVKDIDAAINEAFAKADASHQQVVELSNQWQAYNDKLDPAFQGLGHLKAQADAKHAEFVELRKRADEEHHKAGELRSEVDARHAEVEALYQERRTVVHEIRQAARSLDSPEARERSADDAMRLLRERGRIVL